MATAKNVMELAASFIGTHEDPPGSNNVIFNTDYYGGPVFDPELAWCCAFVWDIFRIANASELFYGGGKTAYCPNVANWARNNGLVVPYSNAEYGDLVLFDWDQDGVADHIGFVVGLNDDGSMETIEGNTSDSDHSNGGYVLGRRRSPDSVFMVVRIQYEASEGGYMFEFSQIQRGDNGNDVKTMQALLRGRGFIDRKTRKLPAVDGAFGEATERCLTYFQEKMHLTVDGVCGPATWAALLYK